MAIYENHTDSFSDQCITQTMGKQSISFQHPVFIHESAAVVGKKEGDGPLGHYFDIIYEDDMIGCSCWEEAESKLQKSAVDTLLEKAKLDITDIRYLFAGDLLGQSIASSFGLMSFHTPLFGTYGACSTCGLTLGLASMTLAGGYADAIICVTSSHFCSAEKEFRFPLGYGNQRPLSATWTVTGSGAFLLKRCSSADDLAKITGFTTGKIVDYGLKDAMNMGACMAPSACDTIYQHMRDFNRKPEDYDKIITGDLGKVGQIALLDLLRQKGLDISNQHMDCGIEIFDNTLQDTHSGGSGCGCSATVCASYLLHQIKLKVWKRILFVPTGALLSKTSLNEGQSIPGIAHAIVIEGR
ncbi:MAG: stage V sporulation protein AD [Eubacteriales bacterium]